MFISKRQRADDAALKRFRKEVIRHKRQPQTQRYMVDRTPQGVYRFSPHDDYLLKAIWWEATNRSRLRRWIYQITLPIRKYWTHVWRGMDIKEHEYLGHIAVGRKPGNGFIPYIGVRMSIMQAARAMKTYLVRHHWRIISALISIAAIYIVWLTK